MPTSTQQREEIPLAQAARLLGGLSWAQIYRLILTKQLDARQAANGRWMVTAASVDEARRERAAPRAAAARAVS